MSDMTRRELKQNELADVLVTAITTIQNNRTAFFSTAAIAFGAIIFIVFFFARYHTLQLRAADKLSSAQGMIAQQQAAQGVQQLDEIINRFSRTTAAAEARLVKSEYLLSQKNYAEAESLLLPVIARGKPATLRPLALVALAAVQEEAGNFPAAVATCQQFLQKYPGHFLTPKMYESIARINLVSGSLADAQAAAEKLTTLYPATPWAERAQQLLRLAPQQSATTAPAVAPLSSSR